MKTKALILAVFATITTLFTSCTTSGNECNCSDTEINQNPVSKQYDIVGTWEYKEQLLTSSAGYKARYVFEKDNTFSYTYSDGTFINGSSSGSYSYNSELEYITLTNKYEISEMYIHFLSENMCLFGNRIYHRVK